LESYLWDDEILEAFCRQHDASDKVEELLAKKKDLLASAEHKGRQQDDVKAISGELYNQLKKLLGGRLYGMGNTAAAFARDTLAPLIVPGTKVYGELEEAIWGAAPARTSQSSPLLSIEAGTAAQDSVHGANHQ
jgi:hypothetical protein